MMMLMTFLMRMGMILLMRMVVVELIMILYLYHLDVAFTVDRSRLGVPQMRFSWRCHLVRVKIGRLGQRCERVRVKRILTDEVASKVDQPDDAIM